MIDKQLPIIYQNLLPGSCEVLCYIISDPAYPLTPYFMKEHTNCKNNNQVVFNSMLCSAQNQIESVFLLAALRLGGKY